MTIYIAGNVCRRLRPHIQCSDCRGALIVEKTESVDDLEFIAFVDKTGGLTRPSKDVICICFTAKKYLQIQLNSKKPTNIDLSRLMNQITLLLCDRKLFTELEDHVKDCDAYDNHILLLTKCVLSVYLEIRLKHACKLMNEQACKSRLQSNKMRKILHFKGA